MSFQMLSKDHSPHLIRSLEGTSRLAGELGPSRHSARRRRPHLQRPLPPAAPAPATACVTSSLCTSFPRRRRASFSPQHPLRVERLIIAADRGHTDAIQLLLRRGTQANFVVAAVLVSEKHCRSGWCCVGGPGLKNLPSVLAEGCRGTLSPAG